MCGHNEGELGIEEIEMAGIHPQTLTAIDYIAA